MCITIQICIEKKICSTCLDTGKLNSIISKSIDFPSYYCRISKFLLLKKEFHVFSTQTLNSIFA